MAMKSTRNAAPVVSLSLLSTLFALARPATGQPLPHWHEARANTARTGVTNLPFAMSDPRLAWRISRFNPTVSNDSLGPTITEVDLDGSGEAEIIAVTDRSLAAWDGATGRRLWPRDPGEYFPLVHIVGVADFDGNGRNDIAVIGRDNTVAIYDASGARRWSLVSSRVTTGFAGTVRVVDYSGTGTRPQLLVVRTDATDTLRASLYAFDAGFSAREVRSASIAGDAQASSFRAAVGDFNGDALQDLLILRTPGTAGTLTAALIEGNGIADGPTWQWNTRSLTPAMGACVPPVNASFRTQVFASGDRDVVAFKQSSANADGTACVGVVGADPAGAQLQWSALVPGPDTTTVPFVGNLVNGGSAEIVVAYAQTVPVGAGTEVQNTVRVFDGATGATVATFGTNPTFTTGYLYLGLAKLNGASGVESLMTSGTSSARYVFRHDGAMFQRSAALNNLLIDRSPRLLIGPEKYGISSAGRNEAIVVDTPAGSAVYGRSSGGLPRLFTISRDETIMGPTLPGVFVAPRPGNRGALLAVSTGSQSQWAMRRLDAAARAEGADARDEALGPPLFFRTPPSYTSTTALRAELRAMPTGLSRGSTILAPTRPAWFDVGEANPFELVPAFIPSPLGCNESISGSNNALTTSAEFFYTSTTAPNTSGNRHFFDRTMSRCQLNNIDAVDFFTAATTGLSFTNDFIRLGLAGPPTSAVLAFAQRDNGTNRELFAGLWPVTPAQLAMVSWRIAANVTSSVPATGSLGERAFAMVITTVGSSSTPPHTANFFLGETPMRLVSVPIPDTAQVRFAPLSPMIVAGSAGSALIVNSNPGHTSGAYTRPSIVRAEMVADSVALSLAGWTPPSALMDGQSAVVVRCGANYRLVFRSRLTALTSDDSRFEAWEFAPTITAPATADYNVEQGMTRAWTACLDRAGGSLDCAMPGPAERYGRASWTNLSAAQNGANPVVFAANSAGEIAALENVCSPTPALRWTYRGARAISSLSVFDADGDGQAEVTALASDGAHHGLDQAECDRAEDPRCPATRPVCDVAQKSCVECTSDEACVARGLGRCDLERRACVPCATAGARCDGTGGTCASVTRAGNSSLVCSCGGPMDCNLGFACLIAGDAGARGVCAIGCDPAAPRCPLGQYCERAATGALGRCVGPCSSDQECAASAPSRPVCAPASDAGARACVECTESAQCAARGAGAPVCLGQRCVECAPGALNSCASNPRGARCLPAARCGCDNDVDCNGGRCDRGTRTCSGGDGGPSGWTDTTCACDARAPARHRAGAALAALCALAAMTLSRRRRAPVTRRTRGALAATVASALLAAGPAAAQSSSPARRAVQCGEDASAEVFAEAREQFDAGQTALLANDAAGAERALRAALALFDSPNTHLLLGRALAAQQRFEDAYDEFETTVLLATRCSIRDTTERGRARYTRSIEQGAAERAQLAPRVALLSVHVESGAPSGAMITVGDRPSITLANERTLAAASGQSAVVVTAPGYRDWRGTVTLERGRVAAIEVTLERIVEGPRVIERRVETQLVRVTRVSPLFRVGLVTAGAGLAAAATGATLFLLGRDRFATLESACTAVECPRDSAFVAAVDRGQRMEFAGQITMYAGIGVMAAGAIVTLATLPRTEWVPAPRAARSVRVLATGRELIVGGTF